MTTTKFHSYEELLQYGREALKKHREGLLQNILIDSETGLETSCSGEALDYMDRLNEYIFTTGSTNTFHIDPEFEEPMWVAAWLPYSKARALVNYIHKTKYPAGCVVQHLVSKKVLVTTMNMELHRWWSADGIDYMETSQHPRAFLQQCSSHLSLMAQDLFVGDNPVVGMWIEYDDETTRTLYDFLLNCFKTPQRSPTSILLQSTPFSPIRDQVESLP